MRRAESAPLLVGVALFIAGCVSTTLDVPESHPASPHYPSAPVPAAGALSAEATPPSSGSAAPPVHDHSHHHGHHGHQGHQDHGTPAGAEAPAGHH